MHKGVLTVDQGVGDGDEHCEFEVYTAGVCEGGEETFVADVTTETLPLELHVTSVLPIDSLQPYLLLRNKAASEANCRKPVQNVLASDLAVKVSLAGRLGTYKDAAGERAGDSAAPPLLTTLAVGVCLLHSSLL
eukprot:Gregarina_sp_Pseudo_9__1679@NODE_2133_length_1134_cov_158_224658_g1967_i0_p1_GENE_NODE_2133_length_1134_cov_158_224658_g1967_i0NODE_2133_length_1134_cov_158_224658_g1967_i0_p1_ORF_typecomplete_len134_score35_66_NODE_2133_length_1134_cov_158_224658_g1967_i0314715